MHGNIYYTIIIFNLFETYPIIEGTIWASGILHGGVSSGHLSKLIMEADCMFNGTASW